MSPKQRLILPPRSVASCVLGCVMRDTRNVVLSDRDRLNYFPASPFYTATLALFGEIHIGRDLMDIDALKQIAPVGRWLFQPPRQTPHTSWNPGPIHAMTFAFFPDAWLRLGGQLDGTPPPKLRAVLGWLEGAPLDVAWPLLWTEMEQIWKDCQRTDPVRNWSGSAMISDWAHHLLGQIAISTTGRGLRSAQRLLQRWTGQNRQTLEFFAKVEEVHRLRVVDQDASSAALAADAGFADQSHMGRALKRVTGFSPMRLDHLIKTEEAFWCYRLLGERF